MRVVDSASFSPPPSSPPISYSDVNGSWSRLMVNLDRNSGSVVVVVEFRGLRQANLHPALVRPIPREFSTVTDRANQR